MKKLLYIILGVLLFSRCADDDPTFATSNPDVSPELMEISEVMSEVYNWQLVHPSRHSGTRTWQRATFYTGVMAAYFALDNEAYLEQAKKWADSNNWAIGDRSRNANDQACGQVYIEIYTLDSAPHMIAEVIDSIDYMIENPKPGRVDWYWADALYMAPPVIAKLGKVTNDDMYFDYLNEMWWDVVDFLYDPSEGFFYRDKRYKNRLNENGKKIFWSRGNGWVIGGLVRILQQLPEDNSYYHQYVELYTAMVNALVENQGEDGLWRPSLVDPEEAPYPETSGSGFFCYAIAWGINNGFLNASTYRPVVEKAWEGLVGAVNEDGRLGWVQSANAQPGEVAEEDWEEYGSGAFLLAGSEMYKLLSKDKE